MNMKEADNSILEIHLDRLEEDVRDHSKTLNEWGQELAFARKAVKLAKNKVRLRAAKLDGDIRANPANYGLEKATDKAVEAAILIDTEYQEEQKDLIQLEYSEDVLDIFFKALVARTECLGIESKLFGQTYWSKPQTNSSMSENSRLSTTEQANEALNNPKKRTKKP